MIKNPNIIKNFYKKKKDIFSEKILLVFSFIIFKMIYKHFPIKISKIYSLIFTEIENLRLDKFTFKIS